jgi:hydrogenase maturation protease
VTETGNTVSVTSGKQKPQPLIRVIGVGSHHGADLLGWLACERLQAGTKTNHYDWQLCRTPSQLPQLVANCDVVVIVDAILSDQSAGQVISLSWPAPYDRYPSICSSHGIGVVEALQLAATLGQLPSHTYLLGITISNQYLDATAIISKALPQLQHALNQIVDHVASIETCNL